MFIHMCFTIQRIGDLDELLHLTWRRSLRWNGIDLRAHFMRSSGSFLFTATWSMFELFVLRGKCFRCLRSCVCRGLRSTAQ